MNNAPGKVAEDTEGQKKCDWTIVEAEPTGAYVTMSMESYPKWENPKFYRMVHGVFVEVSAEEFELEQRREETPNERY